MLYPLGWPLGRQFARLGATALVRVNVLKDIEAGVFVASSRDVPGMVLEAETLDEILEELKLAVPELVGIPEANFHGNADLRMRPALHA